MTRRQFGFAFLKTSGLVAIAPYWPSVDGEKQPEDDIYNIEWIRAASLPDGPIFAEVCYRKNGGEKIIKRGIQVIEEPDRVRYVIEAGAELHSTMPWKRDGGPVDPKKTPACIPSSLTEEIAKSPISINMFDDFSY